jgi:hypothetical protein
LPRVSFTKIDDELSVMWPQLHFGLGFTTLATVTLALSEERIFSVLGLPSLALAMGAAFVGLGAGSLLARRMREGNVWSKLGWLALLNSLVVVPVLAALLSGAGAFLIFVAAALPFVAGGAVVSSVMAEAGARLDQSCWGAFLGAAAGCVLEIPFLILFASAPNTVLASGAIFAISAAIWFHQAGGNARRATAVLVALLFTWAMIVNGKLHWIDLPQQARLQTSFSGPLVALALSAILLAIVRFRRLGGR